MEHFDDKNIQPVQIEENKEEINREEVYKEEVKTVEMKRERRKNSFFTSALKTVSAAVLGSAITLAAAPHLGLLPDSTNSSTANYSFNETTGGKVTSSKVTQVASYNSLADMIEQVSKAIVGITNLQKQTNQYSPGFGNWKSSQKNGSEVESGIGSGVIYSIDEGSAYIVTNQHVIEDATSILVTLSTGKEVEAELIGADKLTDLAVLKIEGEFDIQPLTFGDSSALRAGDTVIAIGNPLGLDLSNTVTQGIVSAVNRTIEVSTSEGVWDMEVIQTDAAINPGNSGGALINTAGELIGINSMKISDDDVEGLGFAIPSNEVSTIITQLIENGQIVRPYLGVSMVNVSDLNAYCLANLPKDVTDGVVIADLDQSGAASRSGLKVGDIIVSINSTDIKDATELKKYLYTKVSIGDEITVQFYRNGKLQEVKVQLTSNKNMKS